MKNLLLSLSFVLFASAITAQKFAYVDSEYVLKHMPEYAEALGQLNQLSSEWQAEIEKKYENIERLKQAYQAEKTLLTEEMKSKRQADIVKKEQEARGMQMAKFGVGGELFSKREELIQPVQELIYQALQDVAKTGSYMVIFDMSNESNLLYANPKYDVTDKVIKKLGLTPGEVIENEKQEDGGKDAGGKGGAKGASKPGGDKGGKAPVSKGKDRVPPRMP